MEEDSSHAERPRATPTTFRSYVARAETHSRDREASQCENPITVPIETPSVKRKSGAETKPSPSNRRPGPTAIATMTMRTAQANGCPKLMVQPIHGRRRGTIVRGSNAPVHEAPIVRTGPKFIELFASHGKRPRISSYEDGTRRKLRRGIELSRAIVACDHPPVNTRRESEERVARQV